MNCKPGDLAVVVAARRKQWRVGRIVTLIEHVPNGHERLLGGTKHYAIETDVWHVTDGREHWLHSEKRIRLIRPDETPEESAEAMRLLMQREKEAV